MIFFSLKSGFGVSPLPSFSVEVAVDTSTSPLDRAVISSFRRRASSVMAAIPGTSGLLIPDRASSISFRARSRNALCRSASDDDDDDAGGATEEEGETGD